MNQNKRINSDGSTQGRRPSDWSDPHQAPPLTKIADKVVSSHNYTNSFSHGELEEWPICEEYWIEDNKHQGHGDLIANSETALIIAICNAEIKKHKTKHLASEMIYPTPEHKAIATYFVSTDNRNVFGRYVVRAAVSGIPVSTADIMKEMNLTRKAVTTMANECQSQGWVVSTRKGGTRYLSSTPFMVEGFRSYTAWAAENWTAVARQIVDLHCAMRLSRRLDFMNSDL